MKLGQLESGQKFTRSVCPGPVFVKLNQRGFYRWRIPTEGGPTVVDLHDGELIDLAGDTEVIPLSL